MICLHHRGRRLESCRKRTFTNRSVSLLLDRSLSRLYPRMCLRRLARRWNTNVSYSRRVSTCDGLCVSFFLGEVLLPSHSRREKGTLIRFHLLVCIRKPRRLLLGNRLYFIA